jgi:hypothetical protein
MRPGEANWILWGLALQAGLCPTCRVVSLTVMTSIKNIVMLGCPRCHRD